MANPPRFEKILDWMGRISLEVEGLREDRTLMLGTLSDVRDLMAHLQVDDRVQREAIANLVRRLEGVEQRVLQ